jgi:hypothetical protein
MNTDRDDADEDATAVDPVGVVDNASYTNGKGERAVCVRCSWGRRPSERIRHEAGMAFVAFLLCERWFPHNSIRSSLFVRSFVRFVNTKSLATRQQ